MRMPHKKVSALPIILMTLFITYLHYSSIGAGNALHNIYRELYYIPVLLGALAYGLRGGALLYLLVFVLYFPYVLMTWPGPVLNETNRLLPLLLQGSFAVVAGYLVDRGKKQRAQLEKNRYLTEIGRVSTVIVHDLKNPLIAILGFAQRLKEGRGKVDSAAQAILNSAEKMQKIVSGVLDFAAPVQLNTKEEDIRNVVTCGVSACRMSADERNVALFTSLPSHPVIGSVDGFHLERALMNFIANAIEASSEGQSVAISVAVAHGYVSIRIKDQGSGMDEKTLEHIFLPFYTSKKRGTGLGMPIAKRIIDGHHGKIAVISKAGQGTEVTIELPS
jgi:two-component system sensor histidine kinase HydH